MEHEMLIDMKLGRGRKIIYTCLGAVYGGQGHNVKTNTLLLQQLRLLQGIFYILLPVRQQHDVTFMIGREDGSGQA
jgi:sulfite exporter TauE/SafE